MATPAAAAGLPLNVVSRLTVQSLSLSILPSSLSVTCQFCQPVSSFSQSASLSVQSACHFCQPSCQPVCQSICRSRQSVSRSVGQLVRSHGRSFPSALVPSRGSVAVEAEGPWGREEPGGGTLTWRRTRRGFCGRRSQGSGGHHPASVASQGRRRDSEKEARPRPCPCPGFSDWAAGLAALAAPAAPAAPAARD